MRSVVKSWAINVTVLSLKRLLKVHVIQMWRWIWVKLREPHIHASNGLSDLTLRETRMQAGGGCDGWCFYCCHRRLTWHRVMNVKSIGKDLGHAPYPVSDSCDISHPSLLLLAFSISGLDHVAPYLLLDILKSHCCFCLFVQKPPSDAAHLQKLQLWVESFLKIVPSQYCQM